MEVKLIKIANLTQDIDGPLQVALVPEIEILISLQL